MTQLIRKIRFEYRVAAAYFLFGTLWIFFSDTLICQLGFDAIVVSKIQMAKGFIFVSTTAFLLILLIRSHLNKIKLAEKLIFQRNQALEFQNNELARLKIQAEEREHQLRLLFDNAPEAICIQVDKKFVYLNKACVAMYGAQEPSQLINTSVFERIPPQYREQLRHRIDYIETKKTPLPILEYENIKLDGTHFESEANSVPITYEGKNATLVFIRDVSERKRNAELIRKVKDEAVENQKLFKAIADTSPLAIYISNGIDEQGEYINPTFERLFGYSFDEIPTAAHWYPLAYPDPEYRNALVDEWKKKAQFAIDNNTHIEPMEAMVSCKDGSKKWVSWGFISIGKRNWVFGQDLTERKKFEEQLVAAKIKAEESDHFKSIFLQNMSHEIRTPMNAIIGFAQLLPDNFDDKQRLEYFTNIIVQRSSDLLSLINDILDLSKIESGQLTLSKEPCDMMELINDLYHFFLNHNILKTKPHIKLQTSCAQLGSHYATMVDQAKLKQIFINLIFNALKFTDKGMVCFGFDQVSEQRVRFFVSDTGIGIPANKIDTIFERFVQLESHNKGGTGLGLPIVKGLVDLMGGEIVVVSNLNQGTTFYFSIPCIADFTPWMPAVPKENPTAKIDWRDYSVLIVEDDLFSSELLSLSLAPTQIQIHSVGTAADAISLFESYNLFNLVLMDIKLPDRNGLEAALEIKKRKPGVKIIAQSAFATNDFQTSAFGAGCDAFIRKPINLTELIETIQKQLFPTEMSH